MQNSVVLYPTRYCTTIGLYLTQLSDKILGVTCKISLKEFFLQTVTEIITDIWHDIISSNLSNGKKSSVLPEVWISHFLTGEQVVSLLFYPFQQMSGPFEHLRGSNAFSLILGDTDRKLS